MTERNPEYVALERVITADKRYRKFMYLLAVSMVVFFTIYISYLAQSSTAQAANAIAKAAADQKIVARETIRYMTCIFVIPIDKRTPAIQQKCYEAADLPGGLNRSDFSPIVIPDLTSAATEAGGAGDQSAFASRSFFSSSPQPNAATPADQPNISQQSPEDKPPDHKDLITIPPVTVPCLMIGSLPVC